MIRVSPKVGTKKNRQRRLVGVLMSSVQPREFTDFEKTIFYAAKLMAVEELAALPANLYARRMIAPYKPSDLDLDEGPSIGSLAACLISIICIEALRSLPPEASQRAQKSWLSYLESLATP